MGKVTETTAAIAAFVEQRDAANLRNPERVLEALKTVKICDPACGSGAYLLGMLHELLDLRGALFTARRLDPLTAYQRKLEIIQNNLYGVDLDPFAVNIARLRLWLSLIVEFEGDNPPPLPNLDFKIEAGDSLTAPDPSGGLQPDMFRQQQVGQYFRLKGEYLEAHGPEKLTLRGEIDKLRAEIAAWAHPKGGGGGFDWAVEFAEVFAQSDRHSQSDRHLRGDGHLNPGGFDIILANPPYVRQELLGSDYKARLKPIYPEAYNGTADLYVYFYARALQLLKPGGMLIFISSNKWLRAAYGEKLRAHLADFQVISITDFGELPVFETAATFPMIFVTKKDTQKSDFTFTQVKSLESPYPDVRAVIKQVGQLLPSNLIDGKKWMLTDLGSATILKKMETNSISLDQYIKGQIYYGIKTGFNAAFEIDGRKRAELIAADPKSDEIIRSLAVGDDVRRWRLEDRDKWLIVTKIGVNIKRYPAIFKYLSQWQYELERRQDQGNYWWELRACTYYDLFDLPKIVYPEICKEPRFAFDTNGTFTNNKAFFIPLNDLYLLGVLNSSWAWNYAKLTCAVLGDENRGGRLMLQWVNFRKLPIPDASSSERQIIIKLAQKCVDARGQGPKVADWEAEINERVARLYGI